MVGYRERRSFKIRGGIDSESTRINIGRVITSLARRGYIYAYTNYLLRYGDNKDKADFLIMLNLPFMLDNRHIYYSPSEFNEPRRVPDRTYLTRKPRESIVKTEDALERYRRMQAEAQKHEL